ncbi:MAG: hypothetical protein R3F14_16505 [Polyangiaceae bacterium]
MTIRTRAPLLVAAACTAFVSTAAPRARADLPPPRIEGATLKLPPRAQAPALALPAVVDDGARRRPAASETDLTALVTELDELLLDTAHDLGLSTDGAPTSPDPATLTDAALLDLARRTGRVAIAPSVRTDAGDVELRVSLVTPDKPTVLTRTERFPRADLAVRAVVMLRDAVRDAGLAGKPARAPTTGPAQAPAAAPQLAVVARSEGRTVLAVNATVFGGMMGFSVERASGSDDPRLLYPLLAVGAGVGLGASLLVASEWDVGTGDAWFLSSGGVWPTAAAHLIYEGRFGDASGHPGPEGERWAFGVVGGTAGLTLATLSLALGDMESGGAVLAHSGGALGLALGGLTEWFAVGDTRNVPFAGMGYGAAIGWLAAAGAATTRFRFAPVRVLSIDLGAVLGGLAGAALASPLVFEAPNSTETRGWLGAIGGGALLGAGVAFWLTRAPSSASPGSRAGEARTSLRIAPGTAISPELPDIGILGDSASLAPRPAGPTSSPCAGPLANAQACGVEPPGAPIFGVRFRGRW